MDRKITAIQSKNLNIIKGIAILMVIMIHCDYFAGSYFNCNAVDICVCCILL